MEHPVHLPSRNPTAGGKKRTWIRKLCLYICSAAILTAVLFTVWFYFTTSGSKLRLLMADSLITTQHRQWAKYLLGEKGLKERLDKYSQQFDRMAEVPITQPVEPLPAPAPNAEAEQPEKPLVRYEEVSGPKFKGYLVFISDPKKLRIVVPEKYGMGEKVSEMVKRTHAVAGFNAGGFYDPNWKGNGFRPTGIVISGGKIFFNSDPHDSPIHIVGIDYNGRLIAGKYKPSALLDMGIKEAVTFAPRFIADGKGLIKSQADGWGIAPRTCIAQQADGTIMFAVIDGRQKHSLGATLYDVQQIFLDHGAVIAANLDGGSSTVFVDHDHIVNSPASEYGERYLPTAWLVFDDPQQVEIRNVWEGVQPDQIDAGKW